MARNFPGTKLWITEYNTFYPSVWYGASDKTAHDAAAFLNATENSAAHGVHVAAHLIATMAHGDLIEVIHYFCLLEGAAPGSYGPNGDGGPQPGFGAVGINTTAGYVRPVGQVLSMFAGWLAEPAATMQGVALGVPHMPLTLAGAGFGPAPVSCLSSSAIYGKAKRLLVINRCSTPVAISLDGVCRGGSPAGWSTLEVYNAIVSTDGRRPRGLRLGARCGQQRAGRAAVGWPQRHRFLIDVVLHALCQCGILPEKELNVATTTPAELHRATHVTSHN